MFGKLPILSAEILAGYKKKKRKSKKLVDQYLWRPGCQANIKIRKKKLKIKELVRTTDDGFELWIEGRDAAGKGGVIRRITRFMNERHYRVVALGRPTQKETSQWYYQRYVLSVPYMKYYKSLDITPDPTVVVSGADEINEMEAEKHKTGKMIY